MKHGDFILLMGLWKSKLIYSTFDYLFVQSVPFKPFQNFQRIKKLSFLYLDSLCTDCSCHVCPVFVMQLFCYQLFKAVDLVLFKDFCFQEPRKVADSSTLIYKNSTISLPFDIFSRFHTPLLLFFLFSLFCVLYPGGRK